MTLTTNGRSADSSNGNRIALRLTLPTLGAISSIAGVIVFIAGFGFGYLTFKSEMTAIADSVKDLRLQTGSIGTRLNTLNASVSDDRAGLTNRLTALETDTKYISRGIEELKTAIVRGR